MYSFWCSDNQFEGYVFKKGLFSYMLPGLFVNLALDQHLGTFNSDSLQQWNMDYNYFILTNSILLHIYKGATPRISAKVKIVRRTLRQMDGRWPLLWKSYVSSELNVYRPTAELSL